MTIDRIVKYEIGSFLLRNDRLIVTDPCYTRQTDCVLVLDNARTGVWDATMTIDRHTRIVQELVVAHHEGLFDSGVTFEHSKYRICVDSGQAGIFDESLYPQNDVGEYDENESFYGRACKATYDEDCHLLGTEAGIIEEGVVSRSGYGDGEYPCHVMYDKFGRVIEVRIEFVSDDDDLYEEE